MFAPQSVPTRYSLPATNYIDLLKAEPPKRKKGKSERTYDGRVAVGGLPLLILASSNYNMCEWVCRSKYSDCP
ncbi:hypothetical protein CBS147347_9719 [Aspergillus niger]|nr:hypothetical protein CBS147347_9719 [Aspergillus niger]